MPPTRVDHFTRDRKVDESTESSSWSRTLAFITSLVILAILVCILYWLLEYACLKMCANMARLRVPVDADLSGFIILFMYLLCWTVSIVGFFMHIWSADFTAVMCNMFPLGMCSYALGLPAVFMCTPPFYKKSLDLPCAILKAIPVALLTAATYCYMSEHPHGSSVMPQMQGIEVMPYAIVLPILPLFRIWYESHFEASGEKRK